MNYINLQELATDQNFNESSYLNANPDVALAVRSGALKSGKEHFDLFGKNENRMIQLPSSLILNAKVKKHERIKPLLRTDMECIETPECYDFLTSDLRLEFNIVNTDAVSGHGYDDNMLNIIKKYEKGLVLDCGAGKRPVYYENVVNFEIVDYLTTDVIGVGEVLPFADNVFDAVISNAVLEHVKDPFKCAREISRVLKPGGELMCCVPLLQPVHGYPNHYYNMTSNGLQNLFCNDLIVDETAVAQNTLPIWSLTWILKSWADGLQNKTKNDFMLMKIEDLLRHPVQAYLDMPFVKELPLEKNFELASCTIVFAHKPLK